MKTIVTRLFAIVVLMAAWCAPQTNAQMCSTTGNVELSITPESKTTANVTYTFTNHNSYQVTVNARITLTDTDGKTKALSRTFVIAANEKKVYTFNCADLGMNYLSPYDCSAAFLPSKCD